MPLQVNKDTFVSFRYEPSYLRDHLDLKSDPKEVCRVNNIEASFSEINLDVGNVVNWENSAVVMPRIYSEKKRRNFTYIKSEIEK